MGNCIGKKSTSLPPQQRRRSSSKIITSIKPCNKNQSYAKQAPLPLNTSSKRSSVLLSHMSDVTEKIVDIVFNENDASERKVIQYSSLSPTTTTPSTNDQLIFMHTPSILLPVQLSSKCKKLKSSNKLMVSSDDNVEQPFISKTNEHNSITMGHLFSKEKDINKENDNGESHEKVNIHIKVDIIDNDPIQNQHYFTVYNDQKVPEQEVMVNKHEIVQESMEISPSSSLFDSSLSSLSCNTTPFSSQDRLILSSSPSSSSSAVILPPPRSLTNEPTNFPSHNGSRSSPYSDQIYLHNQLAYLFSSTKVFPAVLPASSRCTNDFFMNEFHQNLISHNCKTLSSVIDNVVQQQFIRIHQCSKVILIEHKELVCVHLKDVKKFDTPSLIFDEQHKHVHLTKHGRALGLQSFTCTTNNVKCLPKLFSSCDHCSSLLSGSKLNNRLRPFLLVNVTHNLVQMCFNEANHDAIFGYVSQKHPQKIRQTVINNAKFAYSYDLDVGHTSFDFVLRVHSWPQEIRQIYQQRQRVWPNHTDELFQKTCFIRLNHGEQNIPITNKCLACEKNLSPSADSAWSYTYTAIESQLVTMMSDEQIRFASIVWNYLNGKCQGQLPFIIFKHTLFYFFEQYSFDCFTSSDLVSHTNLFTDLLLHSLRTKAMPHYFNSNYNLYKETFSTTLTDPLSIKMTSLDLKNFSVYLLPKAAVYLYRYIYLIQFETNYLQYLLQCASSKTNSIQTILDTHELVMKQLSIGIQTYKRQLETNMTMKTHRPLTLDCLYQYQEQNVQIILDYLPLLREKEPSLLNHSLWSMFIQYFNCLFDDLFVS